MRFPLLFFFFPPSLSDFEPSGGETPSAKSALITPPFLFFSSPSEVWPFSGIPKPKTKTRPATHYFPFNWCTYVRRSSLRKERRKEVNRQQIYYSFLREKKWSAIWYPRKKRKKKESIVADARNSCACNKKWGAEKRSHRRLFPFFLSFPFLKWVMKWLFSNLVAGKKKEKKKEVPF